MATVFLVLLLVVQVAFLLVMRSSVAGAVDAAVRDAARDADHLELHEQRLEDRVRAIVPASVVEDVTLATVGDEVKARVTYRWTPPGPTLTSVTVVIERRRNVVVPP